MLRVNEVMHDAVGRKFQSMFHMIELIMENCNAGGGIKFPNGRHNTVKTYEKKKKST